MGVCSENRMEFRAFSLDITLKLGYEIREPTE
jgi:hypothetical protein